MKEKSSSSTGPKKPQTAYIRYCNSIRKSSPEIAKLPVSEQGKVLGAQWTNASAEQKKEFIDLYNADKKRYDEEMEVFKKTDEYKSMQAAKKSRKPSATKRVSATSAYQCFLKEQRGKLKADGGQFSVGKFSKEQSEIWKNMGATEKARFEKLAQEANSKKKTE